MKYIVVRGRKIKTFPIRAAQNKLPSRHSKGAVVWVVLQGLSFALLSAAALSAQTGDTNPAPAPAPAKKTAKAATTKKATTPTAQPLTIPSDAVAKPDGSYAYTDKAGKKWTYNKTPFGISRIQDLGEGTPDAFVTTPKEQLIQATDAGDTVKFQRQTPFGVTKWEKKKSELNDEERRVLEAQQPKPAPPQPAPPQPELDLK
jgi:hypothetical protein